MSSIATSKCDPLRIWTDGCFDMMHFGHANALRQARALGAVLVVGVHSDEEIKKNKGPPVMNEEERYAAVRACQWADEVVEDAPYVTSLDVMDKYNCLYCVHGDDIVLSADGTDTYGKVKDAGRFKTIARTQGVSTTQLVNRMLSLVSSRSTHSDSLTSNESSKLASVVSISPYSGITPFLPTSRKLSLFIDGRGNPKGQDLEKIVYIDGAFDLFHVGHTDILQKAKELGSYLIVGIWDDLTVISRTGGPVMNLMERTFSVLSCRHVDEVIIGAPFSITDELIKSNNISIVVKGTIQDPASNEHDQSNAVAIDRFAIAKERNLFIQLESPRKLTTSDILNRISTQRKLYEERNAKKEAKEIAEIKIRGY